MTVSGTVLKFNYLADCTLVRVKEAAMWCAARLDTAGNERVADQPSLVSNTHVRSQSRHLSFH